MLCGVFVRVAAAIVHRARRVSSRVFAGRVPEASLVAFAFSGRVLFRFLLFGLLFQDAHHLRLKCLLVLAQAVLFPSEVGQLAIEIMARHAIFKESYTLFVIRLLLKL